MKSAMENWERNTGINLLRKIGLKAGQTILDFGARNGHYSIPAAQVVGSSGVVYALDKNDHELKKLNQKAKSLNLNNIKIVKTNGSLVLDFNDATFDAALLYDVLHYFNKKDREKLYSEIKRVLKVNGLASVYPKHVIEDYPLDNFRHLHLDDLKKEIQESGFNFQRKDDEIISHDDLLTMGCILNFTKGRNDTRKMHTL